MEYPFRQAMSLLRHEIDDEISHRTIHGWAHEEEKEARQVAVFGQAERVRSDGKERNCSARGGRHAAPLSREE